MNKPFAFYASIISGIFLLAGALTTLGFAIYFIAIGFVLEFFVFLFITIVCAYLGALAILHGVKLNKAINTVSTILSLYPDFEKTNSFDIQTQSNKKSSLLIDVKSKKFIFILFDHLVPMYSFSDFVGYDVYENSAKLYSTIREYSSSERNLGWAGARGGNVFTDRVYSLQIVLHLKDAQNPQLVINIISNKSVDRLSVDYREYINSANKLCMKLDQLLQN